MRWEAGGYTTVFGEVLYPWFLQESKNRSSAVPLKIFLDAFYSSLFHAPI